MLVSDVASSADRSAWWEWFPHLRVELVGFHLGLLFESVVGVVVGEGVLNERGKHKHITDPEVNIQSFDGRGSRQRGAGADHQCGHGEDGGDTCGTE